ncbi:MAG: 1-(5-phosphoribosyl)-5-[(5-phosphoribosylamino)methylideneamino]imidazole-4-carboxamide isomerase [Bacteroidales bacterium]
MMQIIPALDIIEGKCVRLSQGDYSKKKIYNSDPVEVAKMFEDWGLKRIHIVDLDGAKESHIVNHEVLNKISSSTSLIIDFGGGIKSDSDVEIAFDSGAEMITGGSIAVKEPETFTRWIEKYGSEKIILGADHRNGKIAISGWMEDSGLELIAFIKNYKRKGIRKVICTDISVDGMLKGPSIKIYSEILNAIQNIELIASGGVGAPKHLEDLEKTGIPSVIVGKAIYEGRIKAADIQKYL